MTVAADIIKATTIKVQRESDDPGPVVITETEILFNGPGEKGHETFYFTREVDADEVASRILSGRGDGLAFAFCKTAFKPYDEVVCALLIAAKEVFGDDIKISSDGTWDEWAAGRQLYTKATGKVAASKLEN
jgi:hypothetical protein